MNQNYYRDRINQRARGRGNLLLNGNNNSIQFGSVITHPPKEVELRVIANVGIYITFLGIVASTIFYLLMVKAVGHFIKIGYISKEYWFFAFVAVILIVGAVTVWIILLTDDISFMIKTAHLKYKDKTIIFDGRERKFYDEIWDIRRGVGIASKVLYCYGVNPKLKRSAYRLRLVFTNEAEAKYLHDIFHAGKYIK